jgi:localization factor PodJL
MTSGVPWQVTGVRRRARDAARDAARRSGISVGEWLDAVILDCVLRDGVESGQSGSRPDRWADEAAADPGDRDDSHHQAASHRAGQRVTPDRLSATLAAFGDGGIDAPMSIDRPAGAQDRSALEQRLREINWKIDSLRQPSCFDKTIDALRSELAEIGLALREAMPRTAVEALQHEVRKLADRVDHSRHAGADEAALASVERGLAEMRDALRGLTPAEGLLGVARVVQQLAQKVDQIGREANPAALKQLEGAIAAMRGIFSHLASNDALTKLSEEVRALAGKIDQVADSAGTTILSALEGRIAILADALEAHNHSRQNVPAELEVLIRRLIDRVEQAQPARAHQAVLEERIAKLIEKLDASEVRLGHLEAIERGLRDLLVQLESSRLADLARSASAAPSELEALARNLADLRRTEKKAQDSLEVVHGTLGHVVDRLAMIETDRRSGRDPDAPPLPRSAPTAVTIAKPPAPSDEHASSVSAAATTPDAPKPAATAAVEQPVAEGPFDQALESVSGGTGSPGAPSLADRVARIEGEAAPRNPSGIANRSSTPDFIAAARRAARAADQEALASGPTSAQDRIPLSAVKPMTRVVGRLRALIVGTTAS